MKYVLATLSLLLAVPAFAADIQEDYNPSVARGTKSNIEARCGNLLGFAKIECEMNNGIVYKPNNNALLHQRCADIRGNGNLRCIINHRKTSLRNVQSFLRTSPAVTMQATRRRSDAVWLLEQGMEFCADVPDRDDRWSCIREYRRNPVGVR